MTFYKPSATVGEIRTKHPFPWREQKMNNLYRMVDANGNEVILFELITLAALVTKTISEADVNVYTSQVNDAKP